MRQIVRSRLSCAPRRRVFNLPFSSWIILWLVCEATSWASSYQYVRVGNQDDARTKTSAGIAMMGGGSNVEEAFRWMCRKANGGDFLILRSRGDDTYNSYVSGLCKLNSVATLIVPSREAAQDPNVAIIIRRAEAVFIAGGDQATYVKFWKETPVQDALNYDIAHGKPIGGISAGMAIQGEFSYGALNDAPDDKGLESNQVLPNPFCDRVTLIRRFLKITFLQGTITDTHFAERDRMGRSLAFLARIVQDGWSRNPREIAVDEGSAVLVEANGSAKVVGAGKGAYFIRVIHSPTVCRPGAPLTMEDISIFHASPGSSFNLKSWTGNGGDKYSISVENGVLYPAKSHISAY